MLIAVKGASMAGSVPHHAGHIIGYHTDDDGDKHPIYCNGHNVSGVIDTVANKVFFVSGKSVACVGDGGASNDACDGSDFVITSGSTSLYLAGRALAVSGSVVSLSPGSGNIASANQNKFNISR